jgi:F-type H+-transporting ATPase subunit a
VIHTLAVNIPVGEHAKTVQAFGLTFNLDTIWASLVAAVVVLALGFGMSRRASSGVPSKLQLAWEALVEQIQDLTDSAIGPEGRQIVPLAICLFVFILVCNWIGFIPARLGHDWLPPATSDVSLPLAMALVVWLWSNGKSIRIKGFGGYMKHYTQPYAFLTPINVIEEITKPITLTFRLFGNVFAGALMVVVLASFGWPITIIGEVVWKPFDLFIGLIQAFIFALLTIMYFGMAMSREAH